MNDYPDKKDHPQNAKGLPDWLEETAPVSQKAWDSLGESEKKTADHPGFEGIDLAPWIDELLSEASAGNHTANILYEIADKMAKGQPADIGEAAFLLGYIKSQQALRADLPAVQP